MGGGVRVVEHVRRPPFADGSFDRVCFVACLNDIPERQEALGEARRVLRRDGLLIVTMISRLIGGIGHRLWWYSEDKHRRTDADELPGMDTRDVRLRIE